MRSGFSWALLREGLSSDPRKLPLWLLTLLQTLLGTECRKLSQAPVLVDFGANPGFASSAHVMGACEILPCAFRSFQLGFIPGSPGPTPCHGVGEWGLGDLEVGKLA